MKQLPIYFLIDSSVSVIGESAESGQKLVQNMIAQWRYDPYALETFCVSIITFNNTVDLLFGLTEVSDLANFSTPIVKEFALDTSLGAALELLVQRIGIEVKIDNGTYESYRQRDYSPVVFLIINSKPTDNWKEALEKVRKVKFASIVALVINLSLDESFLYEITKDVFKLSPENFNQTINSNFRKLSSFILDDELYQNDKDYFWIHRMWSI